jgi:hypothetical protein
MARDYENLHGVEDMDDRELRDFVRERFAAINSVDADDLTVTVNDGLVTLEGRVGTEEERNVADHVLSDVLGLENYENNLVVDPIRRAVSPEAVDDHLADENRHEGLLLGDRPGQESPEADHLMEDLDAQLYGTTDVQRVMEEGAAWNPPEGPTPEGRM